MADESGEQPKEGPGIALPHVTRAGHEDMLVKATESMNTKSPAEHVKDWIGQMEDLARSNSIPASDDEKAAIAAEHAKFGSEMGTHSNTTVLTRFKAVEFELCQRGIIK